jgi:DNA-directed RNA polymerase specialized sigma24 family protein
MIGGAIMALQRNEGREQDEVLQNKFTAYLLSAVQRRKAQYIDSLMKSQQNTTLIEETAMNITFDLEQEAMKGIPLYMRLQNEKLFWSLSNLTERERYVFFNRALHERSLDELAAELGLSYKGVAAIYYRAFPV